MKFNIKKFALRLITCPFVFALIFISHNLFVLKRTYHFLKYGGEYINFEQDERATIQGIFEMLKEMNDNNDTKP